MAYKKYEKRRRKKKRFVEIKTNKRGWFKVQLIKILSANRVLLKLPSGEVISRGIMRLRWSVAKKVVEAGRPSTKSGKKFRTKKKMRRYKRSGKKVNKKWRGKGKSVGRRSGLKVLSDGRVLLKEKRNPLARASQHTAQGKT